MLVSVSQSLGDHFRQPLEQNNPDFRVGLAQAAQDRASDAQGHAVLQTDGGRGIDTTAEDGRPAEDAAGADVRHGQYVTIERL